MIARDYKLKSDSGTAFQAARDERGQDARATVKYPDVREERLSAAEVRALGIASSLAWEKYCEELEREGDSIQALAKSSGLTMKACQDQWRHGQVKSATDGRAEGLTKMVRADFRQVKARFLDMAGMTAEAFELLLRTGDSRNGEPVENMERSARAVQDMMQQVERHFAEQSPEGVKERAAAFFTSLVQWKERKAGKRWAEWESKAQWNLFFTIKNRLADMKLKAGGAGTPAAARNKKQRKGKTSNVQRPTSNIETPRAPAAQQTRTGFTVEMDFGRGTEN